MTRIGTKFLELRLKKKLTLEEVSSATKIKKDFLESIEKGDYKKLPSSAYAYGFVRNYAKFLGINEDQAIAMFKREFDSEKTFDVLPKSFAKKEEYTKSKIRVGRNSLIALAVFIFIIGFIFFQYKDAIFSPKLSVDSPKNNQTVIGTNLQVTGSTDSNSTVYVNDELVSVDDFGNFKKIITIFPGKNTVVIKSTNRFGKQSQVERSIIVKPGY